MLALLSVLAHAGPPAPIPPEAMPEIPEEIVGDLHVECGVEMVSDADGRIDVHGVTGCPEPFARAVRDRLTWMTWKTPPPGDEPIEQGYALLTGYAGVPGGLYVRMGVRFDRAGDETAVTVVPHEVIRARKNPKKLDVPPEVLAEVGEGCRLLVHVDPSGRTERVQSQTCPEGVREAYEVPLVLWSWEPLVVRGHRRAFAVTFRVEP